QFTWAAPVSGDNHCTLSDNAQCIFKNIRFAPGSAPRNVVGKACIYLHNNTDADIFDNCTFVGAGANDTAVWLDNIDCIITINGVSLTLAGTFRNVVRHDCGGKTSWGGTTAANGTVTVSGTGGIIYSRYGATAQVSTSWNTASGSFSATGSVADRQGLIEAFGTSIPGGVTADTTTGGIYVP
ncbi:hypothetical protein, partial [Enterococcus entomosocium]|uniref:hypothetical protein n=1 Tax=Enterococcus entomosocium TaxID=3034352 RepID=UPI0026480C38